MDVPPPWYPQDALESRRLGPIRIPRRRSQEQVDELRVTVAFEVLPQGPHGEAYDLGPGGLRQTRLSQALPHGVEPQRVVSFEVDTNDRPLVHRARRRRFGHGSHPHVT